MFFWSFIPPVAPGAIALFLFVIDYVRAGLPVTLFKAIIYGILFAVAYIRFKEVSSRLQVEADGFLLKSLSKRSETSAPLSSSSKDFSKSASQIDGKVVLASSWPPEEALGWTPFKSLPFKSPKPRGAQHCWTKANHLSFNIRSVGYKQSKAKEPSAEPLYECIGVDLVKSSKLITGISSTPIFQKILSQEASDIPYPWLRYKDSKWTSSMGIPRLIVINTQLPYSSPSLWAPQSPDSDPGFSIVSYYAINPAIAEALSSETGRNKPAVNLLRRLISEGKSSKDETALKAIGLVDNMDEVGFPEMVSGYNGKPVLVTKSSKFQMSNNGEVMEIEFDVRQWSILARKSLHSLKDKLRDAKCQIGMLVEGRTDDELPEQMLGCFGIQFLDILEATSIEI